MQRLRSLTTKTILLAGAAIVLTVAILLAATSREIWSQIEAKQRAEAETHIRTLSLVFAAKVPGARLDLDGGRVARVAAPDLGSLGDLSLVDDVTAYIGGNATVFAYEAGGDRFLRRITNVRTETGARAVGTALAPDSPANAAVRRGEAFSGAVTLFGRPFWTVYHPTLDAAGKVNGILYVGIPLERYYADYRATMGTMALTSLVVALLACLVLAPVGLRLFRPLQAIADRTTRLAEGDLDGPIPSQGRRDEIGAVARALDALRDTSRRARSLEADQRETGAGERARRQHLDAEVAQFRVAVQRSVAEFNARTGEMRARAGAMSALSAEATTAIAGASTGSRETSANVQTVASAADELAASVAEIHGRIDRARADVEGAFGEAAAMNAQVGDLAASAQRIGDVVGLIRAVAEQTNLLALNATIEAARAGEAGRGFAVVAAEVKALAGQTANATDEIASQVARVQTATRVAVEAIGRMTGRMGLISTNTADLSGAVAAQGAATDEISRNVNETAGTSVAIARDLATVAEAAQRTAGMAASVEAAATSVEAVAAGLEAEIGRFLRAVAA
ncbi:methyl-accepting chemotaxis protein [Methylobacterium planeticum]|uniref:HAMP domain-containing protein n=1 Tax=Methylobacterium planeticum TaxID=2615211 RepID=A0A6N6MXT7_9HYPH|nr:methyl-accepting chemotaxis protein [Methylobacterium planeticum]KAB1074860.1 HAMP domain-containing protein [Methylobacterium planeticum]